jgi:uncharacterized protein YegP (UPF0339 family)
MKFVRKRARRGVLRRNQFTYRMVADNGEDIGGGETYSNQADRDAAIDLIKRGAAHAEVIDA